MPPEPRVLLNDVVRAGADIMRFTKDLNADTYASNKLIQAAVERKFEIIGEALNRLQQAYPETAEKIPQIRRIINFRNLLIHGYAIVDAKRVWCYAENYLPDLYWFVRDMLTEWDSQSK